MNYQRIYDSIIARAKSENRVKSKDTYYEAHHVLPVCLGGTGRSTDWRWHPNIALLTVREHFLCHWLLHEIYPNNRKLFLAFSMMCVVKDKNQPRYIPSSRIIEYVKIKFIDCQRNMSQETRDKMSKASKGNTRWLGKRHSEETKRKISELRKGKPGHKHTEEVKRRISESKMGDKNPMRKLKGNLTEEHRRNLSNAQLGSKHPHSKVKCPHCNKIGGKANMVR